MDWGIVLAVAGAASAVALAGAGSSKGVGIAASASDGLISESPEKFPALLILSALPGTQGIYGFVAAFFVIIKLGFLGGAAVHVTVEQGLQIFLACLPVGFNGLISGIWQGKVGAAGVQVVAKHPQEFMKAVILAALVETYAILGLLASILLLMGIKVG
ncbi:MAG: V-type ATP synthase subunit K [Candidatus Schekmanbacteria bacterium]|nr:V-type ATP synthase subunit K [Candidatus Schekmanbacteria bacterium]